MTTEKPYIHDVVDIMFLHYRRVSRITITANLRDEEVAQMLLESFEYMREELVRLGAVDAFEWEFKNLSPAKQAYYMQRAGLEMKGDGDGR